MRKEMQQILAHSQALANATSGDLDDQIKAARAALMQRLESAKSEYGELEGQFLDKVQTADEFIHTKPYHAIGGTFIASLLLGWLYSGNSMDRLPLIISGFTGGRPLSGIAAQILQDRLELLALELREAKIRFVQAFATVLHGCGLFIARTSIADSGRGVSDFCFRSDTYASRQTHIKNGKSGSTGLSAAPTA